MVLVTVGYKQTAKLFLVIFEIAEIGNNKIDAEHIVLGEGDAAIDDYYIVLVFKSGTVHTYSVDTAEEYYLYL